MSADTEKDPVLVRFRAALSEMYGDEIDRVVLFGSRARGDAHADSDYDVAIFLKSMSDKWEELDRLVDLTIEFVESTGVMFDTKPFSTSSYEERTPIMREILRDGLDI